MSDHENVLISATDLVKHFSENNSLLRRLRPDQSVTHVRAVDGVDLAVGAGETVGLVGESGCGKSTFARTLLRLIEPTDGTITYNGETISKYDEQMLRDFRSHAQMIFQDPTASLNPRFTVQRTLTEPMEVHDIESSAVARKRRAVWLLDRVQLSEDFLSRYPHELSGGQCQRVAIARALAVEPDLLVADEPTSALDVSVQVRVLDLLSELQAEMDLSLLFISHDLSLVRQLCDRVAVMYLGKIVERGPSSALFREPQHPYTEALVSSIPIPDPNVEQSSVTLVGDVPTPIDPPSGCRFHPRCPKVIPPEDWSGCQDAWREAFRFKTQVESGTVNPEAIRQELRHRNDDSPDDDEVAVQIFNDYIDSDLADTLPDTATTTLRSAIESLVAGDRETALDKLNGPFSSVCERTVPPSTKTLSGGAAKCHLVEDVHSENGARTV